MRRVYLIATLLFLFGPVAQRAATACRKSRAQEVAACRRAQCGASSGFARRRCVQGCRERSTCNAPGAAIRTIAYVETECRDDAEKFNTVSQCRPRSGK
jgi:hypothetical protein